MRSENLSLLHDRQCLRIFSARLKAKIKTRIILGLIKLKFVLLFHTLKYFFCLFVVSNAFETAQIIIQPIKQWLL